MVPPSTLVEAKIETIITVYILKRLIRNLVIGYEMMLERKKENNKRKARQLLRESTKYGNDD